MKQIFFYMQKAIDQAKIAYDNNEVPVGAIIVYKNEIIAKNHNQSMHFHNPCCHAEMLAIATACNYLQSTYLDDCEIYVTMEPCAMCAYAISLAKIKQLYFGCYDKKSGGVEFGPKIFSQPTTHFKPEIFSGIMEDESKILLKNFFKKLRE